MIQCTCQVENCFAVVNYHSPITFDDVIKSPPFHNQTVEDGEHEHIWKMKEVEFGKKKKEKTS